MPSVGAAPSSSYTSIKFGYAEAEKEGSFEPSLLLDGFLDPSSIIKEVISGRRFLFLGYKGSGKSAIAERLRLLSEKTSDLFVQPLFLGDFPFTDFGRIVKGDAEPESKLPTAWSWLLLLNILDSLSRDEGAAPISPVDFRSAIVTLGRMGLLPSPSLKELVRVSSKKSFKVSIPKFFEAGVEKTTENADYDLPFLVERLRAVTTLFRSDSTHLLILDGLDEILTARQIQYQSLAALIAESNRLNSLFHRECVPVKIILLCRTDLFERLPSANKNKLRQDSACQLDWYHDPRRPEDSLLVGLANLRARLAIPTSHDIFREYFPSTNDDQDIRAFLLDLTRHTPRDFLQLLTRIQQFASHGRISREQLLSGVRAYSIEYFLPEIRDELHGYVELTSVDRTVELIGSLRRRDFYYNELLEKAKCFASSESFDLAPIISALFECSAIGNVHNRPGGTTYYTFKFRNRNSTLNLDDRLILHRGMWKALNLI